MSRAALVPARAAMSAIRTSHSPRSLIVSTAACRISVRRERESVLCDGIGHQHKLNGRSNADGWSRMRQARATPSDVAETPYPASLVAMLEARSVAVVGASPRQGSFGWQMLRQLQTGGFDGELFPVNPSYGEIDGR